MMKPSNNPDFAAARRLKTKKAIVILLPIFCMFILFNQKLVPLTIMQIRESNRLVDEIHRGVEVRQIFSCQKVIRGISVRVFPCYAYRDVGTGYLFLTLSSVNAADLDKNISQWSEKKLVSKSIDISQIKEPSLQFFWFKPQRIDKNTLYCATLTSNSPPGKAVTVYATNTDLYKARPCFVNGNSINGDLVFQVLGGEQSVVQVFSRALHHRTKFQPMLSPQVTALVLVLLLFVLGLVLKEIEELPFT